MVCPWHQYKFDRCTGDGEPGYEADKVPGYGVREENGRLLVTAKPTSKRGHLPHEPHPLTRSPERAPGGLRVGGISTTAMDSQNPRFSTSEHLLGVALEHAGAALGAETKLIRLNDLKIRNCEGYYSKAAKACTWPCSVTSMDKTDQLDQVYEMAVHWADVLLIATPIRWGAASSLYYKMVERMNCIQNQITLNNKVLVVGTSLSVYPAASLVEEAQAKAEKLVNSLEMEEVPAGHEFHAGPATAVVPALVSRWLAG